MNLPPSLLYLAMTFDYFINLRLKHLSENSKNPITLEVGQTTSHVVMFLGENKHVILLVMQKLIVINCPSIRVHLLKDLSVSKGTKPHLV